MNRQTKTTITTRSNKQLFPGKGSRMIRNTSAFREPGRFDIIKQKVFSNTCSCKNVLIVDDLDYNRFVLKGMLEKRFGLKIMEAVNGKDCIEKLIIHQSNALE
jgi:hypothetical protein